MRYQRSSIFIVIRSQHLQVVIADIFQRVLNTSGGTRGEEQVEKRGEEDAKWIVIEWK